MRGQDIDYEGARKTIREVIEERRNFAIKHELVVSFFFSGFGPKQNLAVPICVAIVCAVRTNTQQKLKLRGHPSHHIIPASPVSHGKGTDL